VTVRELAQTLEITPHGAYQMLVRLSRVLPIADEGGVWRVASTEADDGEMA